MSLVVEIVRWILAAVAVVVAFYAALYFNLFVLLLGPFPKDIAEPTAGILMGSLVVLAGALPVPRQRTVVAIVLLVLGTTANVALLSGELVSTAVGGLAAVILVAWWFDPRRTARATRWVALTGGLAVVGFLGVVLARYVDWPPRRDGAPLELVEALGADPTRVAAFYGYDLGGFVDHEWLWRIDTSPEVMAHIVQYLGLRRTETVPQQFWRMPPHYWPRAMPERGEAFQSPEFRSEGRGPDGPHYFLLHDRTRRRVFVWFKSNF